MTTYAGSSAAAALNHRALSGGSGRAVRADAAVAGDTAAASERRALLAEDAAVSSTAGTRVDAAVSSSARETTADAGSGVDAAASFGVAAEARATDPPGFCVTAQPGAAGNARGLRSRVAAQPALAAQRAAGACPADAQTSAACRRGTTLTADTDTSERAAHVRSGSTVQSCALASDQSRLAACAQRGITAHPGSCTGIACTRQLAAGTETCLARQSGLAAEVGATGQPPASAEPATSLPTKTSLATGTETCLARQRRLATQPAANLATQPAANLAPQTSLTAGNETATDLATGASAGLSPKRRLDA
ncbi:hypothetical protein [Mycobacterium stomatepiae]|uniref:hypothetical protein n=1 Tax=Mycobacterium stomatepiae TaxID=470076 RepID=UPI0015D2FED9|nr:hypothetical protein [Mycobacterium stomatepiae]MCV7168252.1 hypothetical protein [Mycobacterium stomatepiae]